MVSKTRIQIDIRERNSGIGNILCEHGYEVEEQQLAVGDFVVEDLVIERKTVKDFQISIIDGRLFRQIYAMRHRYNRCLLIIEENAEETEDNIHINAAQGALIQITSCWQVPYLFSQGASHTATLIEQIIEQESISLEPNEHKTRWGYKPRGEDRKRQYLLEGIRGIGPKRAKTLLLHFGTLRNIFNASSQELARVEGIHEALAVYIDQFVKSGSAV